MKKLFNEFYPQVSFRFIFTNSHTIGSFFKLKDRIADPLCSNIIYQFGCSGCKSRYIGSSSRNLKIRIAEHRGISFRTNSPLSRPSMSEIREHAMDSDHSFNDSNFKILFKARNCFDLRLLESLCIFYLKPELNAYDSAVKLMIVN